MVGTRLKQLRENRQLKQEQVAEIIGLGKSTIAMYEAGVRQPSYDILVSLARLYHVSTDYLLGITNERTINVTGLTENEIEILTALVQSMVQKNKKLNR